MSVHHTLTGPDATRWSMLRLEYAEYNSGEPMSIELDCGAITDAVMDDYQPLLCPHHIKGEHESSDWDGIDEEALAAQASYWFSHGFMITRD